MALVFTNTPFGWRVTKQLIRTYHNLCHGHCLTPMSTCAVDCCLKISMYRPLISWRCFSWRNTPRTPCASFNFCAGLLRCKIVHLSSLCRSGGGICEKHQQDKSSQKCRVGCNPETRPRKRSQMDGPRERSFSGGSGLDLRLAGCPPAGGTF